MRISSGATSATRALASGSPEHIRRQAELCAGTPVNALTLARVIPLVRTDGSAGLRPAAGLSLAGDCGTLALFHCLASGPGPLPAVGYVADLLRPARALAGAGSAAFRCLVLLRAFS